jgi:hypothetical protein
MTRQNNLDTGTLSERRSDGRFVIAANKLFVDRDDYVTDEYPSLVCGTVLDDCRDVSRALNIDA